MHDDTLIPVKVKDVLVADRATADIRGADTASLKVPVRPSFLITKAAVRAESYPEDGTEAVRRTC
jgi:hypothetical protein